MLLWMELNSVPHKILTKKLGRFKKKKKALANAKADWEADLELMGKLKNTVVTGTSSEVVCFNRVLTDRASY